MTNSAEKPVEPDPPAQAAGDREPLEPQRHSWRSDELLGEQNEVLIVHGSEVYRLRRTRQDKLILYK